MQLGTYRNYPLVEWIMFGCSTKSKVKRCTYINTFDVLCLFEKRASIHTFFFSSRHVPSRNPRNNFDRLHFHTFLAYLRSINSSYISQLIDWLTI